MCKVTEEVRAALASVLASVPRLAKPHARLDVMRLAEPSQSIKLAKGIHLRIQLNNIHNAGCDDSVTNTNEWMLYFSSFSSYSFK